MGASQANAASQSPCLALPCGNVAFRCIAKRPAARAGSAKCRAPGPVPPAPTRERFLITRWQALTEPLNG